MKKLVHIFLCLLALFAVFMPSSAQDATTEPRVIRGSKVVLIFKNLPTGEAANVDGEYQVSRSDGTILLPFLESRLSVLGKTARQVEDMVRSQYIA